jgi:hypothetical protein
MFEERVTLIFERWIPYLRKGEEHMKNLSEEL